MLEMSLEFERLYLQYERLWISFEQGQLSEKACLERFHQLRDKEYEIVRANKHIHSRCPELAFLIEKAMEDTYTALELDFPREETDERQADETTVTTA